jgi:hypothetical protein
VGVGAFLASGSSIYACISRDSSTPPFQWIFTLVSTLPESHDMKAYLYIGHGVRGFIAVRASGEFVRNGEVNKKKPNTLMEVALNKCAFC